MPLDPLSILAGQLATQVVALAKAALDAHIGGGPAQRAVERVYARGLEAMLRQCAGQLEPERREELGRALNNLIGAQGMAGALLDLALAPESSLEPLRRALDSPTFRLYGLDAGAALAALVSGLDDALTEEAAQHDSPLANHVLVLRQRLSARREEQMLTRLQILLVGNRACW